MKTLALALLLAAGLTATLPAADAYHGGCQPDYPCTIRPCDAKCLLWHAKEDVRCVVERECAA